MWCSLNYLDFSKSVMVKILAMKNSYSMNVRIVYIKNIKAEDNGLPFHNILYFLYVIKTSE